ncbi:MAG: hypothetical protein ABI440_06285 [Casimicrobiaceae bacterium]
MKVACNRADHRPLWLVLVWVSSTSRAIRFRISGDYLIKQAVDKIKFQAQRVTLREDCQKLRLVAGARPRPHPRDGTMQRWALRFIDRIREP